MASRNTFGTAAQLTVGSTQYQIFRLEALDKSGVSNTHRLPYSIKILLENLLRFENEKAVKRADIEYVLGWDIAAPMQEISFMPARVLLQDFTGVPCVADLAAMRDAFAKMGVDAKLANPLIPVDLVIDHSVQVDICRSKANCILQFR